MLHTPFVPGYHTYSTISGVNCKSSKKRQCVAD
jgi:hypothetical protein